VRSALATSWPDWELAGARDVAGASACASVTWGGSDLVLSDTTRSGSSDSVKATPKLLSGFP
jgi:hypothetical protein